MVVAPDLRVDEAEMEQKAAMPEDPTCGVEPKQFKT